MGNKDLPYLREVFTLEGIRDSAGIDKQRIIDKETRCPMSADIVAGTAQDFYVHHLILREHSQKCQALYADG